MNLENKNYPKWHSIVIKIPSEMISKTKSGRVSLRNTITNLGALSTSNKMKSIKLISSNIDTPEIIENGVKTTLNNEKEPKKIKIKQPKLKSTKEIDKLYNQMEQYNKELKNTKKLKTNKEHQNVINKILKEYINKKRTKKALEPTPLKKILKERTIEPLPSKLFDFYFNKISNYSIEGYPDGIFKKIYGYKMTKKESEENDKENQSIFKKVIDKNPELKKRIIHDYKGDKAGVLLNKAEDEIALKKIVKENKIKTLKQYYKFIDNTGDLRLPYNIIYNALNLFNYSNINENPEPPTKAPEPDNFDKISQELQRLIFITPIDKIKKALVEMNFKGRIETQKIKLSMQILQNFKSIEMMKKLINLLKEETKPEPPTKAPEPPKVELIDNSFFVDVSNSDDAVKLLRIIAKEKNGKIKIPLRIQTNIKLLNREIKKFLKIVNMSETEFMNRLDNLKKSKPDYNSFQPKLQIDAKKIRRF
jgi:hypothetical protein